MCVYVCNMGRMTLLVTKLIQLTPKRHACFLAVLQKVQSCSSHTLSSSAAAPLSRQRRAVLAICILAAPCSCKLQQQSSASQQTSIDMAPYCEHLNCQSALYSGASGLPVQFVAVSPRVLLCCIAGHPVALLLSMS